MNFVDEIAPSIDATLEATGSATTASSNSTSVDWNALLDKLAEWATTTGIKLLICLLILIVSFKLIDRITKRFYKHWVNKGADATLSRVLYGLLKALFKIVIICAIVGYLGFETASISAIIASCGVGISLAVQGTLSNFAGGVIIIIMRPFKLGDFISSGDVSGTVEDIKLFYTHIVTPDNRAVMIPNGTLANNVIVNLSAKELRRCDVVMSVAYDADVELAKKLIKDVCAKQALILKNPAPFVEIGEYADSSINLYVRTWCKNPDYWTVNFYLLKEIKIAFDENNIEIPFNQLDVNIKK